MKNKILAGLMTSFIFSIPNSAVADSTEDLINALIVKGVLTEKEGNLLSKQAEAENKNSGKVKFKKGGGLSFESGDGESKLKVAGRIQLDYRNFDTGNGSSANSKAADGFDVRRAYLGVAGTANKYYGYKFTGSFGSSTKLDEGYLEFKHIKKAKLRMGQFKMPMSLEERTSSRFLNFTERSYVNNGSLTAGKEVGMMIHGTPSKGINYAFAIANGYGQNVDMADDRNDGLEWMIHVDTDLAKRNKWKDQIVHLGASYSHQNDMLLTSTATKQQTLGKGQEFFKTKLSGTATDVSRSRYGLELALAKGNKKFQSEYANASWDTSLGGSQDVSAYYADVGILLTGESYSKSYKSKSAGGKFDRIKPNRNFNQTTMNGGAWELVAGYSKFDASDITSSTAGMQLNSSTANTNEADTYRVGLKFIPDPNTRIMLSYVNTDFDGENKEIAVSGATMDDERAINIRMQYDF
tara:strand:- start:307 stop:1704 length:1398 start_codon:yes stop_codon:yes gene_type:complete